MIKDWQLLLGNTVWFGFWFALILVKDLSPWWFMFPVFIHWRKSDFQPKEEPKI